MMTSYIRKRAALACDLCRHRKRRCDGTQPCATCRDAQAQCIYPGAITASTKNGAHGDLAARDRLARVEALLEEHSHLINDLQAELEHMKQQQYIDPPTVQMSPFVSSAANQGLTYNDTTVSQTQFLIPRRHRTSTSWLLSLPQLQHLLGYYPSNYFRDIEVNSPLPREILSCSGNYDLDSKPSHDEMEILAKQYFSSAHQYYPVLSSAELECYNYEATNGDKVARALLLLVCTLGILGPSETSFNHIPDISLRYLAKAMEILNEHLAWSFKYSVKLTQALVLAAAAFSYLARPLHSYRCIHSAFISLQHTLSGSIHDESSALTPGSPAVSRASAQNWLDRFNESQKRLYWACFLIECDRVAELELPRSGVETWEDDVPLPNHRDYNDCETLGFVAETSARRLLNRIHSSLYAASGDGSGLEFHQLEHGLDKLYKVVSELHRQLESWHSSIPTIVKPDLGTAVLPTDRARVLRMRYYAAMHIIYRPFLLAVSKQPDRDFTGTQIMQHCETCIQACRTYLLNASEMLNRRSPYIWTFSASSLGALFVLSIASQSPQLRHLVTDLPSLQTILVDRWKLWSMPGPIFEQAIRMIETIQNKEALARQIS